MSYLITAYGDRESLEIMVDDNLIDASAETIHAEIGDVPVGTTIYTAGYGKIKQLGLDGTWVEVE